MHHLSTQHDPRFLAPKKIEDLLLTSDKKYIIAYNGNYRAHFLSVFDAETGEKTSETKIFYNDFHFNYGYNAVTDEYFYWTTGETYTSPRCYDIYRIICENGQISTVKTNIDFSTEGYFSYILFTENHVNIVTNECFKQINLKTLAVERTVNSLFLEDNKSNGCAISADAKLVAFGDYHTNKIQVFATETGKLIQEIQTERLHDDYGAHILFIGNTYRIIATAKTNIEVFDAETGKKIYKINTNGFDYYSSIMMM